MCNDEEYGAQSGIFSREKFVMSLFVYPQVADLPRPPRHPHGAGGDALGLPYCAGVFISDRPRLCQPGSCQQCAGLKNARSCHRLERLVAGAPAVSNLCAGGATGQNLRHDLQPRRGEFAIGHPDDARSRQKAGADVVSWPTDWITFWWATRRVERRRWCSRVSSPKMCPRPR